MYTIVRDTPAPSATATRTRVPGHGVMRRKPRVTNPTEVSDAVFELSFKMLLLYCHGPLNPLMSWLLKPLDAMVPLLNQLLNLGVTIPTKLSDALSDFPSKCFFCFVVCL